MTVAVQIDVVKVFDADGYPSVVGLGSLCLGVGGRSTEG